MSSTFRRLVVKSTKKPATASTMRVLKSLSRPLLSKCNRAILLHRSVFGLKGRAFSIIQKLLSHNTSRLSTTISRIGRKRTPGNSGAVRAGSSRICRVLPWFAQVFPGLLHLTLDNPAETVL